MPMWHSYSTDAVVHTAFLMLSTCLTTYFSLYLDEVCKFIICIFIYRKFSIFPLNPNITGCQNVWILFGGETRRKGLDTSLGPKHFLWHQKLAGRRNHVYSFARQNDTQGRRHCPRLTHFSPELAHMCPNCPILPSLTLIWPISALGGRGRG